VFIRSFNSLILFRADKEKFHHFEDEGWCVLNQIPPGEPRVEDMETLSDKRRKEVIDNFATMNQ
jgi:hypothetical protein